MGNLRSRNPGKAGKRLAGGLVPPGAGSGGPQSPIDEEAPRQGSSSPPSDRELLRRCVRLVGGEWRLFSLIVAAMIATALLRLPAPLLTMRVIDGVSTTGAAISAYHIAGACLLLAGALVASRAVSVIQRVTLEKFRYRVTFRLERLLFGHVLKLPLSYHLRHRHGYLMSRVHEDPQRLQGIMADSVLSILSDAITLIVGVVFLISIHWMLTVVSLVALPILVALFVRLRVSLRGDFRKSQELAAQVNRALGDALSKAFTIKALDLNALAKRRFVRVVAARVRQRFHLLRRRLLYEGMIGVVTGLVPIVILGLGAHEILAHRLTVGEFIAFNGFLAYLYRPAEGIVIALLSMQGSLSAVERVLEVLGTEAEPDQALLSAPEGIRLVETSSTCLEFRGVGFRYPDSPGWLFRDISFGVRTGEVLAVEGPSGVGKTTLLNLIPRLLEPGEGKVVLRGADCRSLSLSELRHRVALVSLETDLFGATVRDAISCTDRGEEVQCLWEALDSACAAEFVESLPLGIETPLGSNALNLSAGQRQRLLIARAIIRKPEALILDEATSFLEEGLERAVLLNLRETLAGRGAVICVSHRASTLELADRVLKLQPRPFDEGVGPAQLTGCSGSRAAHPIWA